MYADHQKCHDAQTETKRYKALSNFNHRDARYLHVHAGHLHVHVPYSKTIAEGFRENVAAVLEVR